MTKELIEDFRKIIKPFVTQRLLALNFENKGKSDVAEFEKDFDEICDLAIKALQIRITGKWNADLEINHEIDNRGANPIDITDENASCYKDKQGNCTIHCPHCGCTLDKFACMPHHYCYVCGGKFGKIDLSIDKDDEEAGDE